MFNLLYLNSNYASHMTGVVCILIFMSISYSIHTADYSMQTTGDVCKPDSAVFLYMRRNYFEKNWTTSVRMHITRFFSHVVCIMQPGVSKLPVS